MLEAMRIAPAILLLSLAATANAASNPAPAKADAYRSVGPGGVVEFSDTPSVGAQPVEISPPSTYHAPKLPGLAPAARPSPGATAPAAYGQVAILSPAPDQAVNDTTGDLNVQVKLEPALRQGDRLRVLVDGQPAATASGTSVALHNVFRGTHQLQVQVLNTAGDVLASSSPVTFHMIRPSLNLPRR